MTTKNLVKLGDFITIKHGYAFSGEFITSQETKNILVTPGNFNIGGGFKSSKFKYYADENYPNQYKFDGGDLIVTMTDLSKETDTLGYAALVPSNNKIFLHNQRVGLVQISNNALDKMYLYWKMRTREYQECIANSASGTSVMHTSPKKIYDYEFSLPQITEQKAIASVLSSLDDKIDLLHRQNKTLESMANTLFRQWFIEEAQDDWVEGTLSSIASNVRENVTKQNISSEALYVGLEHIDRRNIALLKNGNGSDVDSNKSKFSIGDILFGKLRPYFHKVCTAPFDGICSTDILVIRPKNHNLQCFCLFAFFQDEVIEFANIASGGTRMPRIDWTSLANYPISLPPDDKLNDFEKIVSIQVRRINFNVHKIKNLENLRDTLLPKLMSGEVRVQYAEEAIASVA